MCALKQYKLSKNSKKCIEFINGDVRDKNTMNKVLKNIDYVFHMAAYLGVDDVAINPIETMEVESIGTQNLIKCSLKHDVEKIIYISTSGVYGKVEFENAVNEDFLVSPSSSYAIAKRFLNSGSEVIIWDIDKDAIENNEE